MSSSMTSPSTAYSNLSTPVVPSMNVNKYVLPPIHEPKTLESLFFSDMSRELDELVQSTAFSAKSSRDAKYTRSPIASPNTAAAALPKHKDARKKERSTSSLPPPKRMDVDDGWNSPISDKLVRGKDEASHNSDGSHNFSHSTKRFDKDAPIDEKIIPTKYVSELQKCILNDTTISPDPSQFLSFDGYNDWVQNDNGSFQDVIADLLDARYLNPNGTLARKLVETDSLDENQTAVLEESKLFIKVVKARKLILKDGRTRDVYCSIEVGSNDGFRDKVSRSKLDIFKTETVSVRPISRILKSPVGGGSSEEEEDGPEVKWNEHLNIPCKPHNLMVLSVWDQRKNYFLGEVRLVMNDLKEWCESEEYLKKWYKLQPRKLGKDKYVDLNKDKYVGGEILLECSLTSEEMKYGSPKSPSGPSPLNQPEEYIRSQFITCDVNLRETYKILLRSCLSIDMKSHTSSISEHTEELLSLESRTILNVFGGSPKSFGLDVPQLDEGVYWDVGEAFQLISYLELLFEKYQSYQVPTGALKASYHNLRDNLKNEDWLPDNEKTNLIEILSKMQSYFTSQVTSYKDFYPYRLPESKTNYNDVTPPGSSNLEALKTTVFMLRMINKEPIYRQAYPDIPRSFREELRTIMQESAVVRFQRFQSLNSPLDETIISDVVEGLMRLAEFCMDDVKLDVKFYDPAFSRELNISQLVGEIYLKYLIMTLQLQNDVFLSDDAASKCSNEIFALYHRVRNVNEKLRSFKIDTSAIDTETWFLPFLQNWHQHLDTKTIEWVTSSLKNDNFEFVDAANQKFVHPHVDKSSHSRSIMELFSVISQELDLIMDLKLVNPAQVSSSLQSYAKTIFNAIDQYCYTISIGENSDDNSNWSRLTSLANLTQQEPKDIQYQTCVKLCNMEYAIGKLEELSTQMSVTKRVTRDNSEQRHSLPITNHRRRASNNESWQFAKKSKSIPNPKQNEFVKGGCGIQIVYAEDLKPCNKNGLSNPYLVIKLPDGTIVPTSAMPPLVLNGMVMNASQSKNDTMTLAGKDCEILRTRNQYDTVNPQWDEKFHNMLPAIQKLEVLVYSHNLISSDVLVGSAELSLAGDQFSLKEVLEDHQTHDVFVELEPQGRVLMRLTLDGDDEDLDFWFRKSRERIWRKRDDFVRGLSAKITPFCRDMILKVIKVHEAAAINQPTILQSMATRIGYGSSAQAVDPNTTNLSSYTQSGVSIEQPVTGSEAEKLLVPLTEYLNKNLETLCISLSPSLAQVVIKRIWEECLSFVELALVPPLYGQIEQNRRFLNSRQITMVDLLLRMLIDFFHADGQGLGIPTDVLRNRKYFQIIALLGRYHDPDIRRLMREYEMSLSLSMTVGKVNVKRNEAVSSESEGVKYMAEEKEWLLRLLRVRFERQEDLGVEDREHFKGWFAQQLENRRK
ncbi:hypothetical protein HK096_008593 [Nowakowskiella sp. JEL0078]|nr:hypothetical protein HK096_008593 [Nowakowskiella sp. JEL0078]